MSAMTPPAAEPRARFGDLLAAEWIKMRSLRSTSAALVAGALVSVGICVNSARSNAHLIERSTNPDQRTAIDPLHAAFVPEAFQILMVVAAAVGAATIFGEYAGGMIRTTFAAVPARRSVVAAKVVVVTAVMLVYGTAVAAASFGVTQAIYDPVRIGLPITAPGAFRAVAGSALLAPVSALVGMALGALIRHTAGTVVASVGVLLLLPRLFGGETYRWVKEIGNAMPVSAWTALVENPARSLPPGGPVRWVSRYPVSVTEAWLVLGAWALVAAAVAVAVVHRRDV
ncbi:ABC transporter permease subunit [Actinocorallia libanotica]|uniref:ABC-2 family transporter n=1 Tax=Actinocorallia libanotica TaxID=46162 RepID=A0ABP4B2N4_9ACTN